MTDTPLVSILIPVYNREQYVGPCIESALNQSFSDFELIIVDNCSTDATWKVCQRFAERDSRTRTFRNVTNIGPVRNWLRCIEEARGRFGKILFSDDLLMPRYLERVIPLLEDPATGFVFTAAEIGPEPGAGRTRYTWRGSGGKIPSRQYLETALSNGDVPVSPGASLFRLSELRDNLAMHIPSPSIHDFPEHGAGPDLLLSLKTAAAYPAIAHLPEPLVFFRDHPGTISRRRQNLLDRAYAQARIFFASAQPQPEWLNRAFGSAWVQRMARERRWINPRQIEAEFVMPGARRPNLAASLWYGATGYGLPRLLNTATATSSNPRLSFEPPNTA